MLSSAVDSVPLGALPRNRLRSFSAWAVDVVAAVCRNDAAPDASVFVQDFLKLAFNNIACQPFGASCQGHFEDASDGHCESYADRLEESPMRTGSKKVPMDAPVLVLGRKSTPGPP